MICQRAVHRIDALQCRKRYRKQDTAVSCFGGEFGSENDEPNDKQKHICDECKITGRHKTGFGDEDCKTGDSAECKVVGKLKKLNANGHNDGTKCQC